MGIDRVRDTQIRIPELHRHTDWRHAFLEMHCHRMGAFVVTPYWKIVLLPW